MDFEQYLDKEGIHPIMVTKCTREYIRQVMTTTWNAALEEAEKKAQKIYAVSKWVTAVTVEDIDNLKK